MEQQDPRVIPMVRNFLEREVAFNRFLGMRVAELRRGFCRIDLPYREEFIGDPGRPALHGGLLSTLVDAVAGGAAMSAMDSPSDRVSTIDLRVDYMRPADVEDIAAEATVSRMGGKVAYIDVRIFHPPAPDKVLCAGKVVYSVYRSSR